MRTTKVTKRKKAIKFVSKIQNAFEKKATKKKKLKKKNGYNSN